MLFATAACNFWCIRRPPDSAPAALTGLLFDWPDTRIIEKTQHFVTSLTFSADVSSFTWLSHYCMFCPLTWLLCCCALHLLFNSPYCRKFLFKLPSTMYMLHWEKVLHHNIWSNSDKRVESDKILRWTGACVKMLRWPGNWGTVNEKYMDVSIFLTSPKYIGFPGKIHIPMFVGP